MLHEDGRACIILPTIQGNLFVSNALSKGLYCNRILDVRPASDKPIHRKLFEFSWKEGLKEHSDLCIREKNGKYSEKYIELTKEYYLNF